ncbi:hypothetical protein ACL9RL_02350 [Plantibacter sp. Mn2098]|uniref:hypothetical protein n=1 Tax=Plantibacter sp. Mn2098 TaxID=3395266 RepID=UPI003BC74183
MNTGDGWSAPGSSDADGGQRAGGQQAPQYGQPQAPQHGQPQAPQFGQPQYGQPQQPQYGQQAPSSYPYGAQPAPAPTAAYDANPYAQPGFGPAPGAQGWAPPPKPGLIPLRPLSFSDLFSAPFQVLRRNPKATFGSALLVQGVASLLSLIVVGLVAWFAFSRVAQAAPEDRDAVAAGATTAVIIAFLIPLAVSIVGGAFIQGVISQEVARGTIGEKLTLGALWKLTRRRFGPLVGLTFLIIAAVVLFVLVFTGIGFGLVQLGGVGIALTVVIGILAALALVAAYVWIGTKIALAPSIIVLEGVGVFAALRRSWALTDRYFWRTFGVIFLVTAVVSVVAQVVSVPISFLAGIVPVFFTGTGSEETGIAVAIIAQGLVILVSLVIGSVTIVISGSVSTVIYIDLRMRKEALDLELARFVEDRAAGRETVQNPYEHVSAGGPAWQQQRQAFQQPYPPQPFQQPYPPQGVQQPPYQAQPPYRQQHQPQQPPYPPQQGWPGQR